MSVSSAERYRAEVQRFFDFVVSSFQWQVVFRDSSAGNSSECTSGKNRDESGRVEGVRYDVLDSLAALSDQTLEDLEAEISLIERWKTTHKSTKKNDPGCGYSSLSRTPECAEMLHTLVRVTRIVLSCLT